MKQDFLPTNLKNIASEQNATITILSEPAKSQSTPGLHFASVELAKGEIHVEVSLLYNEQTMQGFEINDVTFRDAVYAEDDYGPELAELITQLLRGNITLKKGWFGFGKATTVVCNAAGQATYWPRR